MPHCVHTESASALLVVSLVDAKVWVCIPLNILISLFLFQFFKAIDITSSVFATEYFDINPIEPSTVDELTNIQYVQSDIAKGCHFLKEMLWKTLS